MYIIILRYIIVILIFLIAALCNKSKNGTIKTIGFVISVLGIIVFAYVQFGEVIIFNPIFIIIYISIFFGIFLFLYRKYRNLKYQNESDNDVNYLDREISTEYAPSIVGYLVNQKIRYKDLIADIMELYAKKIIDISKDNEQGENKIHFHLIEENYRNKVNSQSQLYLINTLINSRANVNFYFSSWKRLVLEEYKIKKFAKEKDENKYKRIIGIIITVTTILGAILSGINGRESEYLIMLVIVGMIAGAFIGTIVGALYANFMKSSENTNVFLSPYGEQELKKWLKVKKFMKEYTLLKDRSIEEIAIYESYIPYAVALDVNVQYQNTKFDLFNEKELESIVNESDFANFLQTMGIDVYRS